MAEVVPVIMTEYSRLHITPLNPDVLTTILPPSILPNARNISYHTLQTFPEKPYGFVELPKMDAEKIKKKLNGSILKGTKVRIETAKPKKEFVNREDEEPAKPKREKDSKKRKRRDEPISGVEIQNRRVKRGWTTPPAAISRKDKDKNKPPVKSKYTTGPECLFKTVLPLNVAATTRPEGGKPEKRKKKSGKETVVHEFSNTTKYATFLRGPRSSSKTKVVSEYVAGTGWVDQDGVVVENSVREKQKPGITSEALEIDQDVSSEEYGSLEAESGVEKTSSALQAAQTIEEDSPTSSSGLSSEEEQEEGGEDLQSEASESSEDGSEDESEKPETLKKSSHPQSTSSGPPPGLSIVIPDSVISTAPVNSEVHPLEALYKRRRSDLKTPLPKVAPLSFNFFGADEDGNDVETASGFQVPLTPFTQKEFEYRGLRSAAPTPDTAHANKRFIWPTDNDDEDEEEVSSPTQKQSPAKAVESNDGGTAESDFQKWFYEHRGETNRAWKKRRKVVAKEQRQRENRKRSDRSS